MGAVGEVGADDEVGTPGPGCGAGPKSVKKNTIWTDPAQFEREKNVQRKTLYRKRRRKKWKEPKKDELR